MLFRSQYFLETENSNILFEIIDDKDKQFNNFVKFLAARILVSLPVEGIRHKIIGNLNSYPEETKIVVSAAFYETGYSHSFVDGSFIENSYKYLEKKKGSLKNTDELEFLQALLIQMLILYRETDVKILSEFLKNSSNRVKLFSICKLSKPCDTSELHPQSINLAIIKEAVNSIKGNPEIEASFLAWLGKTIEMSTSQSYQWRVILDPFPK